MGSLKDFIKRIIPEALFVPAIRANRQLRRQPYLKQAMVTYRKLGSPTEVAAGPFAGMRYLNQATGSVFLPKVLGTYEKEMHPWLTEIIAKAPDLVIDVGAAEGYYAIGMARRLPQARVIAYDTDRYARHLLRSMIAINDVVDRVEVRGYCTPEELEGAITGAKRPLVISDCEGFEDQLLALEKVPHLRQATMLVELHENVVPAVGARLRARFSGSHRVQSVTARTRIAEDCVIRSNISAEEMAAGLDERRGHVMEWLYMDPV